MLPQGEHFLAWFAIGMVAVAVVMLVLVHFD